MLNDTTVTKFYEMNLNTMAQAFREQTKDNNFATMSFEERFGLLVELLLLKQSGQLYVDLHIQMGLIQHQKCIRHQVILILLDITP